MISSASKIFLAAAVSCFKKACLAGGVYGVLMEWIRRDMHDTPKEISDILSSPDKSIQQFIASIDFSE